MQIRNDNIQKLGKIVQIYQRSTNKDCHLIKIQYCILSTIMCVFTNTWNSEVNSFDPYDAHQM